MFLFADVNQAIYQRAFDVPGGFMTPLQGLESPIVVLCEMGELRPESRRKLWYTGLSRARAGLFVLARGEPGEDLDTVIRRATASESMP